MATARPCQPTAFLNLVEIFQGISLPEIAQSFYFLLNEIIFGHFEFDRIKYF